MDFTCSKTDLLRGVQVVSRAIPSSPLENVLRNLLLKAEPGGNGISLFATDNRISIRQRLAVKLAKPGQLTIPCGLFVDILQSMQTVASDELRVVAAEEGKVEVSAEGAAYDLATIDPRSFPLIPSPEGDVSFVAPSDVLREVIRQVVVTSSSGGPGAAQGYDKALLEAKEGTLTTVTTDTVRLALRKVRLPGLPDFEVMVPIHALQELSKILPASAEVKVLISEDQVAFVFGDTEFQARLCDREFPNYRKIIPKEHARTCTLAAKGLADALKGVMPVAKDSKSKVYLKFGAGQVVVTAQSHEGKARRQVESELTGEPIELAFNARFILDFIAVVDAEKLRWGVTSPIHPAVLEPVTEEKDYLYLLMPINV